MKGPSAGRVIVDDILSDLSQSKQFIHACAYHTESQQTSSIKTWTQPAVKISFLVRLPGRKIDQRTGLTFCARTSTFICACEPQE